jgi:dTMP kinase
MGASRFDNCDQLFHNRSMPLAPFITFEGSEGCGKSTQVERLAERLKSFDIPLLVTREPGGTEIGETIRDLLLFAAQGKAMTPETEVLLFAASRSQLVREIVQPALQSGTVVISDRFADSTTVYQGVARRLNSDAVAQLNRFAVGDCWPDLTFVLDVDGTTARQRMLRRVRPANSADRMEQEPPEFYERVREAYGELARREPDRIELIDGVAPAAEIEREIWRLCCKRFPQFVSREHLPSAS